MIEVHKVWGKEIWIINCPEYCCKLLIVDAHSKSSLHKHINKKETFYCLSGQVKLTVNDKILNLSAPESEPVTILPGDLHRFEAVNINKSVLLEASTFHDDNDVVRLEPSEGAK